MAPGDDPSRSPSMPMKQKMAVSFKSLLDSAKKLALGDDGSAATTGPAPPQALFAKTTAEVDGPDCEHDCETCTIHYPRNFKVEEADLLYGHVKAWSTHALVATGKTDWVRDVEDEKGSVMQAIGRAAKPSNGVSFRGPLAFCRTWR
jgi:glycerol-3-phosphate O-acyltransferase / dihydroxyacetone phosphate acyltransferase